MSGPASLRALALVSFELSLWAVAAGLAQLTKAPLRAGSLAPLPLLAAVLIGAIGFAVFVGLERSGWRWLRRIREFLDETARPLFAGMGPVTLLLVATAAGIGEESLFRGWLQPWLATKVDPWIACAAAAFLFGAAHPISWGYAAGASLLGLALGAIGLFSGGWAAPALAHCLYDALALWWLISRDSSSVSENDKKN